MNKLASLLIAALIVILLLVLTAPAQAEIHDSYSKASAASQADHKTFVVVIGADWCQPCKKMKAMIKANPSVAASGHLVILDYKDPIAKKLYKGNSVPALVRFQWDGKKWVKTTITGLQSYNQLKRFIR